MPVWAFFYFWRMSIQTKQRRPETRVITDVVRTAARAVRRTASGRRVRVAEHPGRGRNRRPRVFRGYTRCRRIVAHMRHFAPTQAFAILGHGGIWVGHIIIWFRECATDAVTLCDTMNRTTRCR